MTSLRNLHVAAFGRAREFQQYVTKWSALYEAEKAHWQDCLEYTMTYITSVSPPNVGINLTIQSITILSSALANTSLDYADMVELIQRLKCYRPCPFDFQRGVNLGLTMGRNTCRHTNPITYLEVALTKGHWYKQEVCMFASNLNIASLSIFLVQALRPCLTVVWIPPNQIIMGKRCS